VAEFLDAFPFPVGADNPLDVFGHHGVLLALFGEPLAGVDEEDVVGVFPSLLHHQDTGRDRRAVEDIGRQADDGIEVVAILDEVFPDVTLRRAPEEHAVRQDAGHRAAVVEVMHHVLDEGEVRLSLGSEFPVGAEAVVILMDGAGRPLGRERRIGDDGIEAEVGVLGRGMLQGVLVPQVKTLIVNTVQDHVHPCQVVGGRVHLLTVELPDILALLRHPQEQRGRAASGVIGTLELLLPGGDDLGENGADLLRSVELARLLPRATGELADEVFVGIAQHVGLGVVEPEVDLVQVDEHLGDEFVLLVLGFPQLGRAEIEILEQSLEVFLAIVSHRAGLNVLQDGGEFLQDEVVRLPRTLFRDLVEEFGGLEEVAQPPDGFLLNGGEHFLPVRAGLIDGVELDPVVLQNLIREEVHPLGEILVEDEAEDVVPKLISPHLPPQSVGDVPELGLEGFLVVFGHRITWECLT